MALSTVSSPQKLTTGPPSVLTQGLRFLVAGGTVALVYLVVTTVLAEVVGLPFELALTIGFSASLILHFTLQRLFVWTHHAEFALPLHHQAARYLTVAAAQYGVTALATSVLPSALGIPTEIVYLATVAVVLATNFVIFRYGIFHHKQPAPECDRGSPGFHGDRRTRSLR
jgi:putative flippase GtrA